MRIGSDLSDKLISNFEVFRGIRENKALQNRYISMQDIYIFDDNEKIRFEDISTLLLEMEADLLNEAK
jgi:hypothetical protein